MTTRDLLGDYETFVARINDGLDDAGIDRFHELSLLDHFGYRTETMEEYESTIERFRALGDDLGAIVVEGRPISVIALSEPIQTGGWTVPFIEILAPKASSPYPSGLEHAEFVTVQRLSEFERRHQNLPFIRDAMSRRINPELKYRDKGISVKFHRLSIGTVVELDAEGIK
jgi:predicted metalloenzyme YecM